MHFLGKASPTYAKALNNLGDVLLQVLFHARIAADRPDDPFDIDDVARIAWWAVDGLRPHLTVLLDADPSDAVEGLSEKDRLEGAGIALHRRARHFFLDLAAQDPERYLVLDARATRDELAGTIAARVGALLGFA